MGARLFGRNTTYERSKRGVANGGRTLLGYRRNRQHKGHLLVEEAEAEMKMATYMFSGFTAALTGLVLASQLVASHPATGETYELTAIAAVVLGGTSRSGGLIVAPAVPILYRTIMMRTGSDSCWTIGAYAHPKLHPYNRKPLYLPGRLSQ